MRLVWSPVYCFVALGTMLLIAGCGTNDEPVAPTAHVAPTKPARVEIPDGPPGPRIHHRVDSKPYVRIGKPRQSLVVDTSPNQGEDDCCVSQEDLLEACAPNCEVYRHTRLERKSSPWHASVVRQGQATITFPGNQCNGAPTEIVVRGIRVDVYRYYTVDPVPDDKYGMDGCTLADGGCYQGETCYWVNVEIDAPDGTKLDHGGMPELKTPCSPWPRCESVLLQAAAARGVDLAATSSRAA